MTAAVLDLQPFHSAGIAKGSNREITIFQQVRGSSVKVTP
jgi:hypothetical protein